MYRSIFFSDHCIKQIDSMLPWVCSVIDHRWRQNVVKTTVTHSPAARVPLLCFYDILTSSVIYYWTDARQHGIYLLNSDWKRNGTVFAESMRIYRYLSRQDDGVQSPWRDGRISRSNRFQNLRLSTARRRFHKNLRTRERFRNDTFWEKKKILFATKTDSGGQSSQE